MLDIHVFIKFIHGGWNAVDDQSLSISGWLLGYQLVTVSNYYYLQYYTNSQIKNEVVWRVMNGQPNRYIEYMTIELYIDPLHYTIYSFYLQKINQVEIRNRVITIFKWYPDGDLQYIIHPKYGLISGLDYAAVKKSRH